jgi:hypothetical protein
LREGIEAILETKLGPAGQSLLPEIEQIRDEEVLRAILRASLTATTPDDVRRVWASGE